jgi:hypothetical protein
MLAGWDDSMPMPPPGGSTQSMWGFHDGGFEYELVHVYGPADARGVSHLDEPPSYWRVTWTDVDAQGGEHSGSRYLSYAHARQRHRLRFEQFRSIIDMRRLTYETNWRG